MAHWEEAPDLKLLAARVIETRPEVSHVEIDNVLFFWEREEHGSALARCYLNKGPIEFFTDKRYSIVVYESNADYMSVEQLMILLLHELMHIPPLDTGKLKDHTVKDFREMLDIDMDWAQPGVSVPDITAGD